jgi:hypothetical protein
VDAGKDVGLNGNAVLTPINITWAMGFSWSSFVAQSTMVHSCIAAGFPKEMFLTEAHCLPPPSFREMCGIMAVNTDDITHFLRASPVAKRSLDMPPLALLDKTWDERKIIAQDRKSFDMMQNGTALGIDLIEGVSLAPQLDGFVNVIRAGVDLVRRRHGSPEAVNSLLGKFQWYDLLNRCILSCFHDVYEFVRREPPSSDVQLPSEVVGEIALNLVLFPFWSVDLTRGWIDTLPVTDASEKFGFGLCSAAIPPSLSREIASLPYDSDTHVRCTPEHGAPPERPRVGTPFRLPFGLSKFRPLLSQRAKWKTHSGGLEAAGVAQGLRFLSRNTQLHCKRGAFLVDARSVIGALRKGRSSAPTLRQPIRRVAALSLACDWTWRYHYVPSESNAADWPSRGLTYRQERSRQRRRNEMRHNGRVRKYSKLERALATCQSQEEFLSKWMFDHGLVSGTDSASFSSS